MPASQAPKSGKKNWFWWIIGAIAIIIIIVVIMMIFRHSGSQPASTPISTATGVANLPLPTGGGSTSLFGGGLPMPGSAPGGLLNPFNTLNPIATIGSGLSNLFHF